MLPKFLHYALWFPRRTSNEYKTSGVAWIHYVRFCFMDVIALVGSHLEKIKPRCSDFWLLRQSQSSPLSMNCFTCVTLLYLHSNCCSPTVICAQKKKEDSFSKRRDKERRTERHWGRRRGTGTEQTDTERGRETAHWITTECLTLEGLQEAVQTQTISLCSNTISCVWPNNHHKLHH